MGTRAFYFPGLRHCIRISGFSIAHHRAAHEIFYRVGGTLFAWSHTSISVWQQSTGIPSLPLIGEAYSARWQVQPYCSLWYMSITLVSGD